MPKLREDFWESFVGRQDREDYVVSKLNGIMDSIRACDEKPDDEGYCACARHIYGVLMHEVELRDLALDEAMSAAEDRIEAMIPDLIREAVSGPDSSGDSQLAQTEEP